MVQDTPHPGTGVFVGVAVGEGDMSAHLFLSHDAPGSKHLSSAQNLPPL